MEILLSAKTVCATESEAGLSAENRNRKSIKSGPWSRIHVWADTAMEASKSCTASVAQLSRASDIFHPYPRYVSRAAPQYQMQTQITQPLPRYSLYTARLMTQSGALWPPQLKLCDLLSATTEFTNCSPPKPKVHRMWYDCFRPKPNVRRKCEFIHIRRRNRNRSRNSVDL